MGEWKKLTKPTTESLVYIIFFYPKTQKDGIEFIYGKDSKKVNQHPIIKARDNLRKLNYLEVDIGDRLKNFILRSKPLPLVEYVKFKISERSKTSPKERDYPVLSDADEIILSKMIDSEWFRGLSNLNSFKEMMYPLKHFWYRDENGKIVIQNALEMLGSILEVIATMNEVFSIVPSIQKKMPTIEDFDEKISFDEFAKNWIKQNFSEEDKIFIHDAIMLSSDYLTVPTAHSLEKISEGLYFLCMPFSLARKLAAIVRVELTIFLGLIGAVKYYLIKRKVPKRILKKYQNYWLSFEHFSNPFT